MAINVMGESRHKYGVVWISVVLGVITFFVFYPVNGNDFVKYDDDIYVTENRHVQEGLTGKSLVWAFTTSHSANWHPVTWLSHMLDWQLFGADAGWHHLVSLLFHAANTLLLFAVLRRMTWAVWRSALVAAMFALHPLHVESVAWVSERKDVLSTLFWLLAMYAYVRYAERPGVARYLLVLAAFCLGLMAKPMLVTLPFMLLLLDYWPLGRFQWGREGDEGSQEREMKDAFFQRASVWRLVGEKGPLFLVALISSAATYLVQQSGEAVAGQESLCLSVRICNALISYVWYTWKMIWPSGLAVFYPHPGNIVQVWATVMSAVVLAGISALVLWFARAYRYMVVGWLWYLGTLVPVIGLVQVGEQAAADRYTYVPLVGLFIIVAWGVTDLLDRWRYRKIALGSLVMAVVVAVSIFTHLQVRHWRDSESLFRHALAVTENNHVAHFGLGDALLVKGDLEGAIFHNRQALCIKPNYADAHNNLGYALAQQDNLEEAVMHFRRALQLKPNLAAAHINLGAALLEQGDMDEAVEQYRRAVEIAPEMAVAHYNLGHALALHGRLNEAAVHLSSAVQLEPDSAPAHYLLAQCLVGGGKTGDAIVHFREALRLKGDWVGPMSRLAWVLATHKGSKLHNPEEAVQLAERASAITNYEEPGVLDTLAAAYAATGEFRKAIEAAEKALDLAEAEDKEDLANQIRDRLALYRANRPYTEPSPKASPD